MADTHPSSLARIGLALVAVAALTLTACGGDDDSSPDEPSTTTAAPTTAASADDVEAYCAELARLDVEQPEAYVGSAEHVADTEALIAVAPDSVRPAIERYRDFLASGFITEDDPDTNQTDSWPTDVQADVAEIQASAETLC